MTLHRKKNVPNSYLQNFFHTFSLIKRENLLMKFKSGILIRYLFQLGQKTDMSELCGLLSQFSKGQKFNF